MKKSLVMLMVTGTLATASMSSQAALTSTGTLTFDGRVDATSCTITGANMVEGGVTFLTAALQATPPDTIVTQKENIVNINNCPGSLTSVRVTPVYVPDTRYTLASGAVENAGGAKGNSFVLFRNTADLAGSKWVSGSSVTFPLQAGTVNIPIHWFIAIDSADLFQPIVSGTLDYSATFNIDYL